MKESAEDFPNPISELPYNKMVELWMDREGVAVGELIFFEGENKIFLEGTPRTREAAYYTSWFTGYREIIYPK